jgi:uncharacterized protein YwgA
MIQDSIFRDPALIGLLVKELHRKDPDKQIGKTVVQKMCYFLTLEGFTDFKYSMYHYGPYSSQVSGELGFAAASGIVNETWQSDLGYFISPGPKERNFEHLVSNEEKRAINRIIERYGKYNAIEMSIIATAIYHKKVFGVPNEKLPDVVHSLKKKQSLSQIRKLLCNENIINKDN